MKKTIILKHQDQMNRTREFFMLHIPKELSFTIQIITSVCLSVLFIIFFVKVDEVIKTHGIIRTKENVSYVQNVIGGKIIELNYKPGQKVSKGDVLYKIDPTIYESQKNNLLKEREDLTNKIEGLTSLLLSYHSNKNLCSTSDSLSSSRFSAYLTNKKTLEIKEEIALQQYNYYNNQPEMMKVPYEIDMRLKELTLAKSNLESYKADFLASITSELNERKLALFECEQNISRLDNQYLYLSVHSPMDGFVQEISSLNIGDYLESNSKVLNIIPNDNQNFRVEIQISSKDIGKIKTGQIVKYRLETFPYYEFKGAEGIITSIDPDFRTSSNNSLYYIGYADIDRTEFSNRHNETYMVKAGLETNVRIVLKRKPIIYFLLKKLDFVN